MLKFEKPDYKVKEYIKDNFYGKFEIGPLEKGFGTTLGNALRRVMLSSLPGDAITSVKIDGVAHEFQKMDGIIEDVTAIVLNLKSIVLKNHSDDYSKILRLSAVGPKVVTAGDIEVDADIEILNPDQVIATIAEGGSLNMEMTIGTGRGYTRAEENKKLFEKNMLNVIAIDSLYSPIERINYEVEPARVGQNDHYDKLVIEVWTNGSITPEEALALAARILIEHFAGHFPLWLSPVQFDVIPVHVEKHLDYAKEIVSLLEKAGMRVQLDARNEKLGYRVREAQIKKIPYQIVVGEKDMENHTVTIRKSGSKEQMTLDVDQAVENFKLEVETKALFK